MSEHYIKIISKQEWHGGFDKNMIEENVQTDMEFYKILSENYKCTCGDNFYKKETAEKHLIENE